MRRELQGAQQWLRRMHLLDAVERVRYLASVIRFWPSNRRFLADHPDFAVPPRHLAYDACAAPNWDYYFRSGSRMARDVCGVIEEFADIKRPRVLEWGCGPGRVIRHVPGILARSAEIHGSDYNDESIRWCRENIAGVQFATNGLGPPLPYEAGHFDFVYAISVLTHLSEENCLAWMREVARVLNDGGVLFFTTHSDTDAEYLLPVEREKYEASGVCVRGGVTEGGKMFGAWHHPDHVTSTLLAGFELLAHVAPGGFEYVHTQDVWIARRCPSSR